LIAQHTLGARGDVGTCELGAGIRQRAAER
jgi:hypothetical protein